MRNYPLLYLEHLSARDLALLAEVSGARPERYVARVRRTPALMDEALARPELYHRLFVSQSELEPGVTPFLAFGSLVHQADRDLRDVSFVLEWSGPGRRLPVFDVAPLRSFLQDGARRYFLVELLASFTRVASGTAWTRTRRGGRRRTRFSELDLVGLAGLVARTPPSLRPAGYRRLGDVALFLGGVLPDHTARRGFTPSEQATLAEVGVVSGPAPPRPAGLEQSDALDLLDSLGERWYRSAVEVARRHGGAGPEILEDVADRMAPARRILTFMADRYLNRLEGRSRPAPPPR